jgi:hypothetical protein
MAIPPLEISTNALHNQSTTNVGEESGFVAECLELPVLSNRKRGFSNFGKFWFYRSAPNC